MSTKHRHLGWAVCAWCLGWVPTSQGDVLNMATGMISLETVPVGHAGNAPDTRFASPGFGAVPYAFELSKFEITAAQYVEFLNAVATTDPYSLYDPSTMGEFGAKIQRSGSPGSYSYFVTNLEANRPVNYMTWGSAARFANWMHNGQPSGLQDGSTTESGSYLLNGATSAAALQAVSRQPEATWVLPSEDEWYKAAYHRNNGLAAEYVNYPTSHNVAPANQVALQDPGNSANYFNVEYSIGSPFWRTEVGEFENSPGFYSTFDQGGNVAEWLETPLNGGRVVRGGLFLSEAAEGLHAQARHDQLPNISSHEAGFRLALVPEPGSVALLLLGTLTAQCSRRAKRR